MLFIVPVAVVWVGLVPGRVQVQEQDGDLVFRMEEVVEQPKEPEPELLVEAVLQAHLAATERHAEALRELYLRWGFFAPQGMKWAARWTPVEHQAGRGVFCSTASGIEKGLQPLVRLIRLSKALGEERLGELRELLGEHHRRIVVAYGETPPQDREIFPATAADFLPPTRLCREHSEPIDPETGLRRLCLKPAGSDRELVEAAWAELSLELGRLAPTLVHGAVEGRAGAYCVARGLLDAALMAWMGTTLTRLAAGQCAAPGCPNPVPPRRRYCSDVCKWRAAKQRWRQRKRQEGIARG